MLTLQDCIAFSGLTPDQLDAVACHQHLPAVIAAEWAESVLESEGGIRLVEAVLVEEVACACAQGDRTCAERFRRGLEEFIRDHPH
jgi:hypothetical protein